MSGDFKQTSTYPTEAQHAQWKAEAEEMDMTMSEWVEAMVEAGRKKFSAAAVEPDESNRELREQRNDLKHELSRARERLSNLEDAAYGGEVEAIKEYVAESPGATFSEIVDHLMATVPERARRHLDELEGDVLRVEDGEHYLRDEVATDRREG